MADANVAEKDTNRLFPVFLKLENMNVLVVGGGNVGLEKLRALVLNAPGSRITLVSVHIRGEIKKLSESLAGITLIERAFAEEDLASQDIVIVAVNDPAESKRIRNLAKGRGKLVNVADQPELCDFYLSSIVQKGNLKIAISTNGKSPTIAKRLKETFNELLPEELDRVLDNMQEIRSQLKGDFANKVTALNRITSSLAADKKNKPVRKNSSYAYIIIFAITCMFLGHYLLPTITHHSSWLLLGGILLVSIPALFVLFRFPGKTSIQLFFFLLILLLGVSLYVKGLL